MTLDDTSLALLAAFGRDVEFKVGHHDHSRLAVKLYVDGRYHGTFGPLTFEQATAIAAHLNAGIARAKELGEQPTVAAFGQ